MALPPPIYAIRPLSVDCLEKVNSGVSGITMERSTMTDTRAPMLIAIRSSPFSSPSSPPAPPATYSHPHTAVNSPYRLCPAYFFPSSSSNVHVMLLYRRRIVVVRQRMRYPRPNNITGAHWSGHNINLIAVADLGKLPSQFHKDEWNFWLSRQGTRRLVSLSYWTIYNTFWHYIPFLCVVYE